jgi:hypothetical protein
MNTDWPGQKQDANTGDRGEDCRGKAISGSIEPTYRNESSIFQPRSDNYWRVAGRIKNAVADRSPFDRLEIIAITNFDVIFVLDVKRSDAGGGSGRVVR